MTQDPLQLLTSAKRCAQSNLYESAKTWCSLLLSILQREIMTKKTASIYCETLVLYADCLCEQKEYKRAMKYYEQTLTQFHQHRLASKKDPFLIAVQQRYATACIKAKDLFKAKSLLSNLSSDQHSLASLNQLASIYQDHGEITKANECYIQILDKEPQATEALFALVRNGAQVSSDLVPLYNKGLTFETRCCYQESLDAFTKLETQYRNNTDILLRVAAAHFLSGNHLSANYQYSKIRKMEPDIVDQMDCYAYLLQKQGKIFALAKLSEELMKVAPDRPEPWVTLARYCEMKGEKDNALHYVNKAIELNKRHVHAYQVKGYILLSLKRLVEAILAFREAHRTSPDIMTYEGLVECYLAANRMTEALATANEAFTLMPKNVRAMTLMGVVLSQNNKRKQALEYLNKASSMDPNCLETAFALANVYLQDTDYQKAIQLLSTHLSLPSDSLHTRLGEIYALMGNHDKAFEHFNAALAINPSCEGAKRGTQELERKINGVEDEDEDEEVEEEEEEEEESDH